jgi:hypothetical protein
MIKSLLTKRFIMRAKPCKRDDSVVDVLHGVDIKVLMTCVYLIGSVSLVRELGFR